MLLLGGRARDSGFSMVHGRQPRLWPGLDGSGGLAALGHTQMAGPVVAGTITCARLQVNCHYCHENAN